MHHTKYTPTSTVKTSVFVFFFYKKIQIKFNTIFLAITVIVSMVENKNKIKNLLYVTQNKINR